MGPRVVFDRKKQFQVGRFHEFEQVGLRFNVPLGAFMDASFQAHSDHLTVLLLLLLFSPRY